MAASKVNGVDFAIAPKEIEGDLEEFGLYDYVIGREIKAPDEDILVDVCGWWRGLY